MAETALADTSFLVALLATRDQQRDWAVVQATRFLPPWQTCEAVLAEAFHFLQGVDRADALVELLHRGAIKTTFNFADNVSSVFALMAKYANLPMAFADACLVRMSELVPNAIVVTSDHHFEVYRRNGRQAVPHVRPPVP